MRSSNTIWIAVLTALTSANGRASPPNSSLGPNGPQVQLTQTAHTLDSGSVLYVDDDAPPGGNGSSWELAFQDLQSALTASLQSAGLVKQIRVAEGIYRPSSRTVANDPRSSTFRLQSNVGLLGGYAGLTGPVAFARDITRFRTILSGDLAENDGSEFRNYQENAYHIVTASGTNSAATLDGFEISGGYCRPDDFSNADAYSGGGLYVRQGSAAIRNCSFVRNSGRGYGSAICNRAGRVLLSNCLISGNGDVDLYVLSGGIGNIEGGRLEAYSCRISGNNGDVGAALTNWSGSTAMLVNCVVSGNFGYQGAIYSTQSNLSITNCTVAFNRNKEILPGYDPGAAGITLIGGMNWITNTIVWQNQNDLGSNEAQQISVYEPTSLALSHSCIQGLTGQLGGDGNFNLDPNFVDPDGTDNLIGTFDDDFSLRSGSPCLDTGRSDADIDGTTEGLQSLPVLDLVGSIRRQDDPSAPDNGQGPFPIVDLGPIEQSRNSFRISNTSVYVSEGQQSVVEVWLDAPPSVPITVEALVMSGDPDFSIAAGSSLQFDSQNFSIPQPVLISAQADQGFTNDRALIRLRANGLAPFDIEAVEQDADQVPSRIFVNSLASGLQTGLSWADAFTELQVALFAVADRPGVTEIWVAQGVYRPTHRVEPENPRTATFQLLAGVSIYGGFNGSETAVDQRILMQNQSILHGDRYSNDSGDDDDPSRDENSYHVVTIPEAGPVARLDGFTITGGHAGKTDPQENYRTGGGLFGSGGSVHLTNCIFDRNWALWGGGAMHLTDAAELRIVNCTLSNCVTKQRHGGAALLDGCRTSIEYTVIDANEARSYSNSGGALAVYGGTLDINSSTFTRNLADIHGAESYGAPGGAINALSVEMSLTGCHFSENEAGAGGAIATGGKGNLYCRDCVFSDNVAADDIRADGGAVYFNATGDCRIENCSFIGNMSLDGRGGGLCFIPWQGGDVTVEDSDFSGNTCIGFVTGGGGLFAVSGSAQIVRTNFSGNVVHGSSDYGGGLQLIDGSGPPSIVRDCRFEQNQAYQGGGARLSNVDVTSSKFIDNQATRGGAVDASNCLLKSSSLFGNNAVLGGAVYAADTSIVGCVISGNYATQRGGAIRNSTPQSGDPGRLEIGGCTIAHNSAGVSHGGLDFVNAGRIVNSIVWGNSDATGQSQGAQIGGGLIEIEYCDVQSWIGDLAGEGNFGVDPLFMSPSGPDGIFGTEDDDNHLIVGSPCINAGSNYLAPIPESDIDGDPRIQQCRVDMGADETLESLHVDCDLDGVNDACAILDALAIDCNENHVPDSCDLASGLSSDSNQNSIPDECEPVVLRVDKNALGSGDGSTWTNALSDLQVALDRAREHHALVEIWVAAGVYRPDSSGTNRYLSFRLSNKVELYGGFAGLEIHRDQRDFIQNETVLSGELRESGRTDSGNRSLHVVTALDVGNSAVLDGFVISGGSGSEGGGLYLLDSSPIVRNCRIRENFAYDGGGVYARGGHPRFERCLFSGNFGSDGAACFAAGDTTRITFTFTDFWDNTSNYGGALSVEQSAYADVHGCRFLGEIGYGCSVRGPARLDLLSSVVSGCQSGGILLEYATCNIVNSTVFANTGDSGVLPYYSELNVENSILWGNRDYGMGSGQDAQIYAHDPNSIVSVSFTCIESLDTLVGNGNFSADPLLADALGLDGNAGTLDDDHHLSAGSPCIDQGNPAYQASVGQTDIDGDARIINGRVDVGCDEFVPFP